MDDALSQLFALADTYVANTKIAESTLSGMVLKGGNRLRDLRLGETDIGHRRLLAAIQWFSDHWPPTADWPAAVPRPAPTPAEAAS